MVSLCYRPLVNFITDDNLAGLQNFLENKRVQVDDRDEVRFLNVILDNSPTNYSNFNLLEWKYGTHIRCVQGKDTLRHRTS